MKLKTVFFSLALGLAGIGTAAATTTPAVLGGLVGGAAIEAITEKPGPLHGVDGVEAAAIVGGIAELSTGAAYISLPAVLAWPAGALIWKYHNVPAVYPGAMPGTQEDYSLIGVR